MRKYRHLILPILLVASIIAPVKNSSAGDVDKAKASQVGAYFLASQFGNKGITAESLTLVHEIRNAVRDIPALYFFNTADGRGSVIISGSDCMDPIIAYSTDGAFDPTDMPDNLRWWLSNYVEYITYAQNNELQPSADNINSWNELVEERLPYFGNQTKAIITLLETKWDQDTYYNAWSPSISGERCYAGCVATAMGQILRYWKYPKVGTGTVNYYWSRGRRRLQANFDTIYFNYDNMPIQLNASTDPSQIREVARLLYYVGLSVEMDYGTDNNGGGSGANPTKEEPAFENIFKYQSGGASVYKDYDGRFANNSGIVNAKDSAWVEVMRNEILNRRPICYGAADPGGDGRDAGGHAFVCDGYNTSTDKFRFNWGWGGSANSLWFNVYTATLKTPSYTFSTQHHMVYNIMPPADSIPTSSIQEVNNPFTTAVYPNPANSQVTVNYELPSGNAAELQVLDISGRVVKHFTILPSSNQITIPVSDLTPGIYFCRLQGYTTKFIVK